MCKVVCKKYGKIFVVGENCNWFADWTIFQVHRQIFLDQAKRRQNSSLNCYKLSQCVETLEDFLKFED